MTDRLEGPATMLLMRQRQCALGGLRRANQHDHISSRLLSNDQRPISISDKSVQALEWSDEGNTNYLQSNRQLIEKKRIGNGDNLSNDGKQNETYRDKPSISLIHVHDHRPTVLAEGDLWAIE